MSRESGEVPSPSALSKTRAALQRNAGYVLESIAVLVVFTDYWDASGSDSFYGTAAQVIATMYVAVSIEFFAGQGVVLDAAGRVEFVFLLGASWLGLIAATDSLVRDSPTWAPSVAAAGMVASVFLVTTALGRRVNLKNAQLVKPVVYVAAFAPVFYLIIS